MSDDEDSYVSHGDENQSRDDFKPWFRGGEKLRTYLKDLRDLQHVPGEELDQVLPEHFHGLVIDGHVRRESKDCKRVLYLLQNSRRWSSIELSDKGASRATPEFLSLVVLALTKTDSVATLRCPLDENFFACLNSGIQTLKYLDLQGSTIRVSYDAAAMLANGLALSGSLERLDIMMTCPFEPGAGLKLVEGIKRNNSLTYLNIHENNLSTVAMISILRALSEGCLPKLKDLVIGLNYESDECAKLLTKLISSDTCHVEDLFVDAAETVFRTDGVRMGKQANLKLKVLGIDNARFDESYLATILPLMPALSKVSLCDCDISDLTPIVDHLCRPNTAIKSIDLQGNPIEIDQAEKFVGSLADMQSLTHVDFFGSKWTCDVESRVRNIVQKVSNSCNLEKFQPSDLEISEEQRFDLRLNLAINRAWRRELRYKNSSPPSKLLPLVIARALRKTEEDLRADVVLPLLRERMSDLVPMSND